MFQNKDFANVAFQKNVFGEFNKNVERIPCHTHKSEFNKVKEKKYLHTFFINHVVVQKDRGKVNPIFGLDLVNSFKILLSENRKRKIKNL